MKSVVIHIQFSIYPSPKKQKKTKTFNPQKSIFPIANFPKGKNKTKISFWNRKTFSAQDKMHEWKLSQKV